MNYAQLLYALRAACRGWVALSHGDTVPSDLVRVLAGDMLTLTEYDAEPFHDARVVLLSRRPLTVLDHCVYAVVEVARMELLTRREVVDAVAHNAILCALTVDQTDRYIVDLLRLFPSDLLREANTHLATRVVMRDRPEVFHLAVAMLQERIGPSSPDDLAPTAATQHDVAQEPNAHDG